MVVVVVVVLVVVVGAAVVVTGGRVAKLLEVVVASPPPLHAAAMRARLEMESAILREFTVGVYGKSGECDRVGYSQRTLAPGLRTLVNRLEFVAESLAAVADADAAEKMAAYMKTTMPFYGVKRPQRDPIFKEMLKRFPVESQEDYETAVLELWAQPHREEKYLAVGVARKYGQFITLSSLPIYKKLIVDGAWWDFVDEVAAHLVGKLLLAHRREMQPKLDEWVGDEDMWLRRSALLAHLTHKERTDESKLFEHCLLRAHETEFFIRKAIGWVLREYAKTSPDSVRRFIEANDGRFSGLTVREAMKHLR